MFCKLDLFIQTFLRHLTEATSACHSLKSRRRGPRGLEPPPPAPASSPESQPSCVRTVFAAGSLWEVLIVCFATCSLELRENCKPPAEWVMTVCVCVLLYIHLCAGSQCMCLALENIMAGFSMYEKLYSIGSGSHSFSKLKARACSCCLPIRATIPTDTADKSNNTRSLRLLGGPKLNLRSESRSPVRSQWVTSFCRRHRFNLCICQRTRVQPPQQRLTPRKRLHQLRQLQNHFIRHARQWFSTYSMMWNVLAVSSLRFERSCFFLSGKSNPASTSLSLSGSHIK